MLLASNRKKGSDDGYSEPRGGSWMTVEQAAAFLRVPVVTLRRSLERNARKEGEGSVTARVDGITARKLGRLWRVWLDSGWLQP